MPGESLPELAQSIRRLVTFAYPKLKGDAQEELIIEKFLDALPTAELRKVIYQSNPRSINEAVESGLKSEAWSLVEAKKHGKSSLRVIEEEEESESVRILRNLQQRMNNMEVKTVEKNNTDVKQAEKRVFECYYCGKSGHVMRDCRSKQRDEKKQKEERSQRPQKGTKIICYKCGGRECPSPAENE